MQGHGHPGRTETYRQGERPRFARRWRSVRENCERFEIPYGDGFIPGLLVRAEGDRTAPPATVLYVNGLDSCKELLYWSGLPRALARRGITSLSIDQPGTGETLRIHKPAGYLRDGAMGEPGVRLARVRDRCRRETHRHGGYFTRRPLRRPSSRERTALRLRAPYGVPITTGRKFSRNA